MSTYRNTFSCSFYLLNCTRNSYTSVNQDRRTHATPTITVLWREDALEGSTSLAPLWNVGVVAGAVNGTVESVLLFTLRFPGARVLNDGLPEANLLESVRCLECVELESVNDDEDDDDEGREDMMSEDQHKRS